jgi:CRISPR/Cas system Type II protein with McrA/HNH and RuvC-like nuclease domain
MIKNILGLDLGTNSIGWALIKQDFENKQEEIPDVIIMVELKRVLPLEYPKSNSQQIPD